MKYLLDTNTCVYFLNRSYPKLCDRILRAGPARLAVSALTVAELAFSAAKSKNTLKNRNRIEVFTDEVRVEPFAHEMATCFGDLKGELSRTGKKIGDFDLAIAAVAMVRGYVVVTQDADFRKIASLKTEDWTAV
jgi:tRNA(fMet)-specific endonuclease VapC